MSKSHLDKDQGKGQNRPGIVVNVVVILKSQASCQADMTVSRSDARGHMPVVHRESGQFRLVRDVRGFLTRPASKSVQGEASTAAFRLFSRQHVSKFDILETIPPAPVLRLSLEKSPDRAEIPLVAEEIRLLFALGPKLDGVRKGVHRLGVATNERATKINVFEIVFLRLKVGNLTDVVGDCI